MLRVRLLLLLLVLPLFSTSAFALNWHLLYQLCPEQVVRVPELIPDLTRDVPIPVGCEVIDCCPGCPGPGPLDWKIFVDEGVLQGAELRFEGLDRSQMAKLEISGNAKLTGKGILMLGTGETVIRGIPEQVDGKIPVAFVVPQTADSYDLDEPGPAKSDEQDFGHGIHITQYRGSFPVNTFRAFWVVRWCPRPRLTDKLRINNNTSNDTTISFIDFRSDTGACVNDQIVRTINTTNLGSVLRNSTCNSEVAVFSDDNAMAFDTPVNTWTDPLGDIHTVTLNNIITVPVSVWVANNAQLAVAQNDIANANLLYNQNNVGVQFNATFTDVSANAAAVTQISTGCPTAATVAGLQGSAWYTANTLNAYYVNRAFTGVNCGQDRNMQFIGTTANLGSLPHEFGHAYGLRPSASAGHTNAVAGFGNNNIMWGGGPGTRNWFTIGQSFRLNTDTTSMLNANGDRTGSTRTCLPNVSSITCPVLSLDSVPH